MECERHVVSMGNMDVCVLFIRFHIFTVKAFMILGHSHAKRIQGMGSITKLTFRVLYHIFLPVHFLRMKVFHWLWLLDLIYLK